MKIIKITPENLRAVVKRVLQSLRKGGVVGSPTDTVYGLIAKATDKDTVSRVFKVKQRDPAKPLPVLVRDLDMAKELAIIPPEKEDLLNSFWPGKLTVVFKSRARDIPQGVLSEDNKIGLRVPDYKFLDMLLKSTQFPLTGTSANVSGAGSLLSGKEVVKQFKNQEVKPDIIVDGGKLEESLPSTVVDLTNFRIIREGAIPSDKIKNFQRD